METFVIDGGYPLVGEIAVSGAKNVALKACVVALLTDEPIVIKNVPDIRDVGYMLDVLADLGVRIQKRQAAIEIQNGHLSKITVDLEAGARLRTSILVIGPLLARYGEAKIPNPGGCRIGARPVDRHMDALRMMGAEISYDSGDGFFHAKARKLHGATIRFPKNTHTGTESLILAGVLAEGTTILENAAEEVEVNNLIELLNSMGAKITRTAPKTIIIKGVPDLHGTDFAIMPDRNEEVTFAIASVLTGGNITVHNSQIGSITAFLETYKKAGGSFKQSGNATRYWADRDLKSTDVITGPHPFFMTDWQAPWAVCMTHARGISSIHETVFESRFSYVKELQKMGADIEFFDPHVSNPAVFYNFNIDDSDGTHHQAIKIHGPTKLHNAVLEIADLRAGATLVLAALVAQGKSYIHGIDQIDRGYEKIDEKLTNLGARISRIDE